MGWWPRSRAPPFACRSSKSLPHQTKVRPLWSPRCRPCEPLHIRTLALQVLCRSPVERACPRRAARAPRHRRVCVRQDLLGCLLRPGRSLFSEPKEHPKTAGFLCLGVGNPSTRKQASFDLPAWHRAQAHGIERPVLASSRGLTDVAAAIPPSIPRVTATFIANRSDIIASASQLYRRVRQTTRPDSPARAKIRPPAGPRTRRSPDLP
jgi:hypothetical protein